MSVFLAMDTQWNMGPAGPVGLLYASLPEVWRRTKTPANRRDAVFDGLRVMEAAALEAMHSKG